MGRNLLATDDQLIQAAIGVISRRGLAHLTLAEVAAEAGLTAPTLVQRFGSKRGLLLAVAKRSEAAVTQQFASVSGSPLETLLDGLVNMAGPIQTPGEVANHLSFLQLDLADPEFRELAQAHSRAFRDAIAVLRRQAMAAGEIPPCAVDQLARSVQVAFSGVLVQWAIDGEDSLPNALRREVNRQLSQPREESGRIAASLA
ncbi:MAG: TetR/AcrR family transcriptional regulator [Chloroflexota bacterium]